MESGASEDAGRDIKRRVATGDGTRVSGISLLRHNRLTTALHDTTGLRHRAFEVFRIPATVWAQGALVGTPHPEQVFPAQAQGSKNPGG